MNKRTLISLALGVTSVACAAGVLDSRPSSKIQVTDAPEAGEGGQIAGLIRDAETDQTVDGALVILQCDCLTGDREKQSNGKGVFLFSDLPAGTYTVLILHGQSEVSHILELAPGKRITVSSRLKDTDGILIT